MTTCLPQIILHAFNDAWPYWWARYLKSYHFTLCSTPTTTCHCTGSHPPFWHLQCWFFFSLRVSKYLSPVVKVLEACYTGGVLAPIFRCVVRLDGCNYFYSCTFKSTVSKHVTNTIKCLILHGWASCCSPGIPYTPCELLTWNDCDREKTEWLWSHLENLCGLSLYSVCHRAHTHHTHLLLTSALITFLATDK